MIVVRVVAFAHEVAALHAVPLRLAILSARRVRGLLWRLLRLLALRWHGAECKVDASELKEKRKICVNSALGIPSARRFVQQLPPPSEAPFVVVNDTVPSDEREEILNALADEGASSKTIRSIVRWVITRLALELRREPTDVELAQRLLDTMHHLVQYGDDPPDIEQYSRVTTTLMPVVGTAISPITKDPKGRGDCDDLAVLFSALCRAAGMTSNVIWVDQKGAAFNHIASVMCANGDRCYWVEATLPGARVGEATREAVERLRATNRQDFVRPVSPR